MSFLDLPSTFVDRCNVCKEKHESKCEGHYAIADELSRMHRPIATRAAMVRLVVAQQWAVAMALWWTSYTQSSADKLAALPCADDVVAEALGEK